jgi:hypothetical protein
VTREDVRQGRRVAEGVHVVAHLRAHPETVPEVALAVEDLAVQAHERGEVHVRLDVLAARDVPPAALDQPPHPLEELGVDTFHLLEEPRLPAGEDELGVLVAAVRGGAERGQRLVDPGLPGPQPHGIDMGVANHVNDQPLPPQCLENLQGQRDVALRAKLKDIRRPREPGQRRPDSYRRYLKPGS